MVVLFLHYWGRGAYWKGDRPLCAMAIQVSGEGRRSCPRFNGIYWQQKRPRRLVHASHPRPMPSNTPSLALVFSPTQLMRPGKSQAAPANRLPAFGRLGLEAGHSPTCQPVPIAVKVWRSTPSDRSLAWVAIPSGIGLLSGRRTGIIGIAVAEAAANVENLGPRRMRRRPGVGGAHGSRGLVQAFF